MKVGDLIKYRDRKPTDPHPDDVGDFGAWGCIGIVIEIMKDITWIKYIDVNGDHVTCKREDVEVISESR